MQYNLLIYRRYSSSETQISPRAGNEIFWEALLHFKKQNRILRDNVCELLVYFNQLVPRRQERHFLLDLKRPRQNWHNETDLALRFVKRDRGAIRRRLLNRPASCFVHNTAFDDYFSNGKQQVVRSMDVDAENSIIRRLWRLYVRINRDPDSVVSILGKCIRSALKS